MARFIFPSSVEIHVSDRRSDPCLAHAACELARLLKRAKITARQRGTSADSGKHCLILAPRGAPLPAVPRLTENLFPDAHVLEISKKGIAIASASGKGILNGVYELAELLGFVFLMPGEEGERAPKIPNDGSLAIRCRRIVMRPRFKYRGVFYSGPTHDFGVADWLVFFAKLRFNAVRLGGDAVAGKRGLFQRLGLRAEAGGHGYRDLLPRNLFARNPGLFRMRMPEDFGGKRVDDYNSCAANIEARKIMRRNFEKLARDAVAGGYHAMHLWPDDLPGGGWCLCPLCRGFGPSDQAMLAMRNLAAVVREKKLALRVPMLAYHDTMMPNSNIPPAKENFLLFAPRERCYGHGLDDPGCARNRFYLKTLVAWMKKFRGVDDAHTFEYYFDRILYRGLAPYLPEVIARDMRAYEKHGIKTHMALQVGGPAVAPEWNMLFFAKLNWDRGLSPKKFNLMIGAALGGGTRAVSDYLDARAAVFTSAMRMCDYDTDIYLDYRWLPENTGPFGRERARDYAESSNKLARAAAVLEKNLNAKGVRPFKELFKKEVARARFEAAELAVMSHQQEAVNHAACHLVNDDKNTLRAAIVSGRKMIDMFKAARVLALRAGIPKETPYFRNVNQWLTAEMRRKIKVWAKGKITDAKQ
ncbi:MAG: DUF4838 domain-containing protein [Verrucomicrobiae bacterium]|nr:DUF4838 domain-containing protein [Verrucomicrobiae bacterium]